MKKNIVKICACLIVFKDTGAKSRVQCRVCQGGKKKGWKNRHYSSFVST